MKRRYIVFSLLVSLLLIAGCEETGNIVADTCPQYQCRLTTTTAQLESQVLDDNGGGCATDCKAEVKVKNNDNQATRVSVSANCYTVNKNFKLSSETYWLQPNEEHKFEIKVDAGLMENWRCDNFEVFSDKINSCELYQVG